MSTAETLGFNKINMITEFKDYRELPFSESIQTELFKRHEHLGPDDKIYYSERDILIILQMMQKEFEDKIDMIETFHSEEG